MSYYKYKYEHTNAARARGTRATRRAAMTDHASRKQTRQKTLQRNSEYRLLRSTPAVGFQCRSARPSANQSNRVRKHPGPRHRSSLLYGSISSNADGRQTKCCAKALGSCETIGDRVRLPCSLSSAASHGRVLTTWCSLSWHPSTTGSSSRRNHHSDSRMQRPPRERNHRGRTRAVCSLLPLLRRTS